VFAQTQKQACLSKKHERRILKARRLFKIAGGLLSERQQAFLEKASRELRAQVYAYLYIQNCCYVNNTYKIRNSTNK
jgi:hypothetical protein